MTSDGAVGIGHHPGEATHQRLAGTEIEPGGGLVEQQQLRVGHQGPGDLDPLALAFGQSAVGALGDRGRSPAARAAQRPQLVGRVVVLAATAEHRVAGGDDRITHQLARRACQPPIDRARKADTRAQLVYVRHRAGGRVRAARRASRPSRRRAKAWSTPPAAAWSCRRRWSRARPSARRRARSSRRLSSRVEVPRRTVTSRSTRTGSAMRQR